MDAGPLVLPPRVARPLRLLPFRGIMLAAGRIGAPSSVRAFTRPYREVPNRLQRWEAGGQLIHDAEPAVYLHEFTADGTTVRGLVGALDISRQASARGDVAVFPHEGVHPAQADELAARMTEMQTNPAPILLVHRGPASVRRLLDTVQQRPPTRELTDRGGQHHRVWAIRDRGDLAVLAESLAPTRALIADGHHRYTAYLQMQRADPRPSTSAGLAILVDQDDTPLLLGPIHRVLGHVTLEGLLAACDRAGVAFTRTDEAPAVAALPADTLAATDGRRWALLRLALPSDRIAVEVLHDQLLPALAPRPTRVGYQHTVDDALAAVTTGPATALLMPAPDFAEVLAVCGHDRLLPEKATSFQPKPNVGVLIRSLRDG